MRKTLLMAVVALFLAVPGVSLAQTTVCNEDGDSQGCPKTIRTPEPATILLVAGAAGAAALVKLRNRRK